jgi:hypothetical protein
MKTLMALMRAAGLIVLPAMLFAGTIIHVPGDYTTIQSAVNAAINGDTVLVEPGNYQERINFLGKAILVASNFIFGGDTSTIASTIIDADTTFLPDTGSVVFFGNGEDSSSVLKGFTLINGTGTFIPDWDFVDTILVPCGGGIFCQGASPTITNNAIVNNGPCKYGGGICCLEGASPIITENMIASNSAQYGGGVFCRQSSPVIGNNSFSHNDAPQDGGGINCSENSNPEISSNDITGNTAGRGAGINCFFHCSPTIIGNLIDSNYATGVSYGGGGIRCYWGCAPLISDNIISRNFAQVSGGGIACNQGDSPTITGNIIVDNESVSWGGGILCNYSSSPMIDHNTILGNLCLPNGGQIGCAHESSPTISNNIIANSPQSAGINGGNIATLNISFNDVWNNAGGNFSGCPEGIGDTTWGSNANGTPCDSAYNIICDPILCNPDGGDYYLLDTSCCRGAGDGGTDIGARPAGCGTPICGDINGDWEGPNVADLTYLVDFLFRGGPPPPMMQNADVNGSGGGPNVADLTYLVDYMFRNGPELNCQ